MTSEYQAMSDTDAYEHSEHESSRPSATTASALLRSRSAVAKKADPAPSTSFENEPELLNYADGAQVPDSVYKKIRRNLHLKKTDRERFREEGVRRRQARKYEPSMEFSRVSAHCVCESFELADILNTLISSKKSHVGKPVLYTDVICFKDVCARAHRLALCLRPCPILTSRIYRVPFAVQGPRRRFCLFIRSSRLLGVLRGRGASLLARHQAFADGQPRGARIRRFPCTIAPIPAAFIFCLFSSMFLRSFTLCSKSSFFEIHSSRMA